jgi:hypothetical protein
MATKYTITMQKQDSVINPAGTNFDDIWEVHYKVTDGPARGTAGVVKVSESDHNAAFVDAAIQDKISALSGIANLGS